MSGDTAAGGPTSGEGGDAACAAADALERMLLGGESTIPLDRLAAGAGMSPAVASLIWHALGFADSEPPGRLFAPADAEGLALVAGLAAAAGGEEELAVEVMRALGHHMSRLVTWQVIGLAEHLAGPDGTVADGADKAVAFIGAHLDEIDRLVSYGARRHLASVVKWLRARGDSDVLRFSLSVGFADMVAYTTMAAQLDALELARLVARFEAVSATVVLRQGGRVIKTVGDEVLFSTDTPEEAAGIALDLADAAAADPLLLDVRVGLATGQVVSRLGDVFGPTVNLAHRLTAVAPPGSVLVDAATAAALVGHEDYEVTPLGPVELAGVGTVEASQVKRS